MLNWPAVIKYEGDDELTYIASEEQWKRDAGSHLYNHSGYNYLIDSNGHSYNLVETHGEVITPQSTGASMALQDFIKLVRIHASTVNRCCIEKIGFRSIAEGISLVGDMNEQD